MSQHEIKINKKQIQRRKLLSGSFTVMVVLLAIASIIPLFMIVSHIFKEGFSAIQPEFLTSLPKPVGEEGGGIANALVGTIMLIVIASVISLPPGIMAGLFLAEKKNSKIGELVRLSV